MTLPLDTLSRIAAEQPYPLLFATLSGAHLYGFPSPDSDYDLRGVHVLPAVELAGLKQGPETLESSAQVEGIDLDLVTHDAGKFMRLMLTPNGYVLEQLLSPLVVLGGPGHERLCRLARGCITWRHANHYLGFAQSQWKLFSKEQPPRIKPLLYVFRVLLTGIHLMQQGEIEASLPTLNQQARLSYLSDLIARKGAGPEKGLLSTRELLFYESEYLRLLDKLEAARNQSKLPEFPSVGDQMHEFLLELRGLGA